MLLDGSDIKVDLNLEYRQKGLLWYSTYRVLFDGKYRVTNYTDAEGDISFDFSALLKAAFTTISVWLSAGRRYRICRSTPALSATRSDSRRGSLRPLK